jgi:hypothetical protein
MVMWTSESDLVRRQGLTIHCRQEVVVTGMVVLVERPSDS